MFISLLKQRISVCAVFCGMIFCIASPLFAQEYAAHTRVELVAEHVAVPREGLFFLGLRMIMDDGWHVYWRNPGDSGLPPSLVWSLPPAFSAGDIQWPYPQRIPAGPLASFGYEDQVLLVVPVKVPDGVALPPSIDIKLDVSWLACKVDCIPGQAQLQLALPLSLAGEEPLFSAHAPLFAQARTQWPVPMKSLEASIEASDNTWQWTIRAPFPRHGAVQFFPFRDDLISHAQQQALSLKGDVLRLDVARSHLNPDVPERLEGVLVHEAGWDRDGLVKAVTVNAPVVLAAAKMASVPLTWWLACIFAFLGGIILNFMPCVLPVLSIKVLQLVQRETQRERALAHAFYFLLGIMVSFWTLAIVLLLFKAAGHAVGWGFQFQSPLFVGVMALILFIFAMNLFGFFEFSLTMSGSRTGRKGFSGSFLSGVFMTLLATPCTAPFMGSALGFALTQPWPVGILVFTFLGLGLASPMMLLTAQPHLMRFVPKPGPWMFTLKRILGILLIGCVLWLVSVLAVQLGFQAGPSSGKGIPWRSYDAAAVEQARAQGNAVFIDFTAAWCLTCKVNDLVALRSPQVVEAFKEHKVEAFLADWTNQDPDISEALSSYGRSSVPFYVYYAPGSKEPEALPELLTSAIVLDVLKQKKIPFGE